MDILISLLTAVNFMLATAWFVVSIAQMDRRYAARAREEQKNKSILRGRQDD